jgi:hypothetical protein
MIKNLWELCDEALDAMVRGFTYELGTHLKLQCDQEGITLPNSMRLRYRNLHRTRKGIVYDSRYGPVSLYGGKLTENVIQALARIVVFTQTAKLDQWLRQQDSPMWRYKLAHSVHDEIVCVCPEAATETVKQKMTGLMSVAPAWAGGLPVACEVKSGLSYGQCK